MKCPYCGSGEFWPSRKRWLERLLGAFLPYRPYRCRSCLKRYLVPESWYLAFRRLALPALVVLILVLAVFSVLRLRDHAANKTSDTAMAEHAGAEESAEPSSPSAAPASADKPGDAVGPMESVASAAVTQSVAAQTAPPPPKPLPGARTAYFQIYLDIAPKAAGEAP